MIGDISLVVSAADAADEAIIARGLTSFVDVGLALSRIRDRGDYVSAGYATFEQYCRERWGMGRAYAYRQIDAAEVSGRLSPIGDTGQPLTESVIRPLTRLPPEQQAGAWREAVESAPEGRVTARHVAAVVAGKIGDSPKGANERAVSSAFDKALCAFGELNASDRQAFLWRFGLIDATLLDCIQGGRRRDAKYLAAREVLGEWDDLGADAVRFALDGGETYLALLGIPTSPGESAAKKAFRQASLHSHPDRGGSPAVFSILSSAYSSLLASLKKSEP